MDLNKFTEKSQTALTEAQAIGTRHQHQAVDVEHLALALLEQEEGLVPRLLEKAGRTPHDGWCRQGGRLNGRGQHAQTDARSG
jgi:ATP-dependent Clp protease ATP-binding subunit ClpA